MSTNTPFKTAASVCTKSILQELFCVCRPENHYGHGIGALRLLSSINIGFRPRRSFTRNLNLFTNRPHHHTSSFSRQHFLPGWLSIVQWLLKSISSLSSAISAPSTSVFCALSYSYLPSPCLSPVLFLPPSSCHLISTPYRHGEDNHGNMTKQTEHTKSYPFNWPGLSGFENMISWPTTLLFRLGNR